MTLEQLIVCDAATLEKMTDTELLEHFKPYFPLTRPEMATPQIRKEQQMLATNPKLAQGIALAKTLGIDVDMSLLTYRKKK